MLKIIVSLWNVKKFVIAFLAASVVLSVITWEMSFKYHKYRKVVASTFKDPDSAKFTDEKITSKGIYCANVNSKNSYGAYTGAKKMISDGECYSLAKDGGMLAAEIDNDHRLNCGINTRLDIDNYALEKEIFRVRLENERRRIGGGESDFEIREKSSLLAFNARYDLMCK